MTTVDTPLAKVLTGPRAKTVATELRRAFGIETVGDLLRHYPRRYFEWSEVASLDDMVPGEEFTLLAQVVDKRERHMRSGRGNIYEVTVRDSANHRFVLSFFAAARDGQRVVRSPVVSLRPGTFALFAGTVSEFRGQPQLSHPGYEVIEATSIDELQGKMLPFYPSTKTVRTWEIAKPIRTLLDTVPIVDPMPGAVLRERGLLDLATALRWIHRPESYEQLGAAKKRLTWDEAFAVQLALVRRKVRADAVPGTARRPRPDGLLSTFDSSLPYELTAGQVAVGERIAADLARDHPMHRLLQGEVGSGKTIVALRAMLQVVDAGAQAALLAPTEVLAAQHHRSIRELLGPLGRAGELPLDEPSGRGRDDLDGALAATEVALVTGSQSAAARRDALAAVASGRAGIVIGTHALLSEGVAFADLGLVVVDEQHRFGVEQRDALRAKAAATPPHVLVMTATPIPRTVAMTVFGDLETSELTELPRGRAPITSHVVKGTDERWLARTWARLREEVEKGHQAYVVCPRIGGDGVEDAVPEPEDVARRRPVALLEVAPQLREGPLHGLRVGVLHGRLPGDEKDRVMRDFAGGRLDVLIATTVIEVGVDVPNATVMVVLDADRFGMSQLHQLRGRVGRGSAPGLCLLVTEAPGESIARERLEAVASTLDGFRLARLDLELRREGDVLGEAQSGSSHHLRLLSLVHDEALIGEARAAAIALVDHDPQLRAHRGLDALVASVVDEERAEFLEKG